MVGRNSARGAQFRASFFMLELVVELENDTRPTLQPEYFRRHTPFVAIEARDESAVFASTP